MIIEQVNHTHRLEAQLEHVYELVAAWEKAPNYIGHAFARELRHALEE